ncbi:MAG: ABC transporter substrate-binding protein, partial [Stellaceae bacterium]
MPRWCIPRFAAPLAVLATAALAACAPPPMVAAPLSPAQPPYGEPPPMPAPPSAAAATGPAKVALLVPLSGGNAELGKAILNAAQLALFETGGDRLTLVPRDTGGTPQGAANAARAAIGEGAKVIFGPL